MRVAGDGTGEQGLTFGRANRGHFMHERLAGICYEWGVMHTTRADGQRKDPRGASDVRAEIEAGQGG